MFYNVLNGQDSLDACIQLYGSLDYLGKFLNDNSLGITESLPQGLSVEYDETVGRRTVTDFISKKNINILN